MTYCSWLSLMLFVFIGKAMWINTGFLCFVTPLLAHYLFAVAFDLMSAFCSSPKGQAEAAASSGDGPTRHTVKDVCAAYCSLAEIYLSDLWYSRKPSVLMHQHCGDNRLTTVLLPCALDLAAWRKARRTNVESVSREHYSTTVTARRLCSSWPVTCSARREIRSASTHTHTRRLDELSPH